jgi:hypothetical protein
MRNIRVLCYADMDAILPHCVAAAEMLRRRLGAHIIMTVLDRNTFIDKAFENYELYDHESLFQLSNRLVTVKPVVAGNAGDGGNANAVTGAGGDASAEVCAGTDANAAMDGDTVPNGDTDAPRRIDLFGLRKVLARSDTLRKIYAVLRQPQHWPSYAKILLRRSQTGLLIGYSLHYWRRGRSVRRFLQAIRPDVIILAEDNVERLSIVLINEGVRQGIPSIIIPFTIPNPLEPAKAYRDRRPNQVRGPLARLLIALYPKWRFRLDGQDLLRVPAFMAFVLELLGQSSPAPWILNRGGAARIALDSEVQLDGYLKLGFPPAQLSVVGDVNGETLHQGLVNKPRLLADLCAKHGFQPDRPLILCGFPPNQFGSKADDFEFQDYDALIEAWIESFRALGDRANIIVRPHPRADMSRFEAFAAPNVRFTWQPTAELIPLCDLYVASISATIRWAISCGIPVVNYDTYRYRYGDYDKAAGVIQTEALADFRAHLTRFVNDPSYAADLVERQRSAMQCWGTASDKMPERFAGLVLQVIDENKRASSIS